MLYFKLKIIPKPKPTNKPLIFNWIKEIMLLKNLLKEYVKFVFANNQLQKTLLLVHVFAKDHANSFMLVVWKIGSTVRSRSSLIKLLFLIISQNFNVKFVRLPSLRPSQCKTKKLWKWLQYRNQKNLI